MQGMCGRVLNGNVSEGTVEYSTNVAPLHHDSAKIRYFNHGMTKLAQSRSLAGPILA